MAEGHGGLLVSGAKHVREYFSSAAGFTVSFNGRFADRLFSYALRVGAGGQTPVAGHLGSITVTW